MFRVRRDQPADRNKPNTDDDSPARLPLRWAVIGSLAVVAGVSGFTGGAVTGITLGVGVAAVLHKLIA